MSVERIERVREDALRLCEEALHPPRVPRSEWHPWRAVLPYLPLLVLVAALTTGMVAEAGHSPLLGVVEDASGSAMEFAGPGGGPGGPMGPGGENPWRPVGGLRQPLSNPTDTSEWPRDPLSPEQLWQIQNVPIEDIRSAIERATDLDVLKEKRDLLRARAIYLALRKMAGPGKVALLFGARKAGKTGFLGYFIHFLHRIPHVYFVTNTTFRKEDPEWAHLFHAVPGYPIPIAKVNVVSNTLQALNVQSHIKDHWIQELKKHRPKDLARFERNIVLDDEPWIIMLLDEAGGFLSKMRSASEGAVVTQSWVDMSRKLGMGLVFVFHDRTEPQWYLKSWANVDAQATKFRTEQDSWIDILLKPEGAISEKEFIPVRLRKLPLVTLPWQTRSTASFRPELFPGMKTDFTLQHIWLMTQEFEVPDADAPAFVIEALDVAQSLVMGEAQARNNLVVVAMETMRAQQANKAAKTTARQQRQRTETPEERAVRERRERLARMPGAQVRRAGPEQYGSGFGA